MDRPTCSQLRAQLQEIKALKAEFDLELLKLPDNRDTSLALSLEEEMLERLGNIHDLFLDKQMKEAEQIMQQDFLGPEAIEQTFGIRIETKDIPPMPFSKAELERAKELGQFLVLRVDKTPDGQPLTMKNMNDLKGGKTKDGGKVLCGNDEAGKLQSIAWYKDEAFFTTDTPSFGWSLVSKEVIPNSLNKDYLEQTKAMAKYLNKVFKDQSMPLEYQEAVTELNQVKDELKPLMKSNRELAAEKIEQLKINQLFRHSPVEFLYDILLKKEKTGEHLLLKYFNWTKRRCSGGLVSVSSTGLAGADVSRYQPDYSKTDWGVCFYRSR